MLPERMVGFTAPDVLSNEKCMKFFFALFVKKGKA